jgi:hypothetical protein
MAVDDMKLEIFIGIQEIIQIPDRQPQAVEDMKLI